MKFCDLHTHSCFSDGTFTPAEIIDSAINTGLSAVALCDHNTVDGLPEFLSAAFRKNIIAIPGIEISTDYSGQELHLLALYIPENRFTKVSALMQDIIRKKEESNIQLISALNKAGYKLSFDKIKNSTPNGKFNRAHIAAELTKMGYTESIKQAFSELLAPGAGFYTEPERLSFFDALRFVKYIGAVPVLAHPFLNLNEEELKLLLPVAKAEGLAGMECYYSLYDELTTEKSIKLADIFNLKYSGGSDFHGLNKPDISLGTGKGNLKIPLKWAIQLKE